VGAGALTERDTPAARRGIAGAALLVALAALAPARAPAQADPTGRWMTLETAHFRIHVRPAEEALGARVAGEAEAAWAALAARLPPPSRRVDLVVSDNADYANGFTTVFPSPRIVVFPFTPTGDVELQRYDRWLRLLVTHELTHVFHLDLARGWWRVGRAVVGRAPFLFPNALLPTWLTEGLAVHYESDLTAGGRDRGSFHPAVVAAEAAERGPLPIDAANAASPRWPGGIRPYAFGATFLADLARRDGDSALARLALETARVPLPYLFLNRAVRRATGESATQAWAAWQRALAGSAAPGSTGAAPVAGARGLRTLVAPRASPDGARILFVRDDGREEPRIAVLDRGRGTVRPLARVNGGLGVAWDTAGGVLASEFEFDGPYALRAELYRVAADGRETRLTRGARLIEPDVGTDGSVFAVRVGAGENALVRWSAESTRTLTPAVPLVEWAQPRLSPDGRLLAATRALRGRLDVVLLAADGRFVRDVTRDAAVDQMPAFSPDGAWLFWASDRSGSSQLYATRLADSTAAWWRVTGEPFGAYAAAPARDSVFFLAYHSDGYALAAVPFDTVAWTRVAAPGRPADAAAADLPADAPGDSTPRAAILARHAYRPWPALLPQYWLPIGAAQGRSGWAGVYSSGADALGRHAWALSALAGTGLAAGTWRADVGYQYAGLGKVVLDAALSRAEEAFTARRAPPDSGVVEECCLRTDEASVGVSTQLRRYRSPAAARVGVEYQREWDVERAGAVVSAAAARVEEPAFAVSAQRGWRASAFARHRWRLAAPGGYTEGVVRGSAYLPLPGAAFARSVLAVRAAAGFLTGTDSVLFGVGGLSGGAVPLLPGFAAGTGTRDFPARGFAPDEAVGRGAASATVEWRVPVALVGRGLGLAPGSLDRLSVAAFADGAVAWSSAAWTAALPGLVSRRVLASAGVEGVADLGVLYDYPVRLRLGGAQRLSPRRGVQGYLAIGAAF
jgi:hypothetical protein